MTSLTHNVSGIYQIRNTINGHCYIGSAVNIRERWYGHTSKLNRNKHPNPHLQSAWNKYGADAFKFTILEACFVFALIFREQHYINLLSPVYNIATTAGSLLGMKHTLEARAKISAALKERIITPETRAKLSASNSGKTHTAESRAKMSVAKKGKPAHNLGKKASPETRIKISLAGIGRVVSSLTRAKMSASQKGKTLGRKASEETKLKNSLAHMGNRNGAGNKGKKTSDETKKKLSIASKSYFERLKQKKEGDDA